MRAVTAFVATMALVAAVVAQDNSQPAATPSPNQSQSPAGLQPSENALAKLWFKEDMGYAIGTLSKGAPSHTNNGNTYDELSDALVGKSYTLVVANNSSPVRIKFLTAGKVYLLAGLHSRASELAALARVAKHEPTLTATDNTVWSITAEAGTEFTIPFQVTLIAEALENGSNPKSDAVTGTVESPAVPPQASVTPPAAAAPPPTFHSLQELLDTVPDNMWPEHLYGRKTVDAKGKWIGGDFDLDDVQMQVALDRIVAINELIKKNAIGATFEMDMPASTVHDLQERFARDKSEVDMEVLQQGRSSVGLSPETVVISGISRDYKDFTSILSISETFNPDQLEQISKIDAPTKTHFGGTVGKISLGLVKVDLGALTPDQQQYDDYQAKKAQDQRDQRQQHNNQPQPPYPPPPPSKLVARLTISMEIVGCKIEAPLRDGNEGAQEKLIAAQQALDAARAAALRRFQQTPEYKQAEAAVENAQTVLDGVVTTDARAQAATDKLNAKARLERLQDDAIASDQAVLDATKAVADASAEIKLAQAQLDRARADQAAAAAEEQARVDVMAEPKAGDSEDDLVAYAAKKGPSVTLTTKSETPEGKVIVMVNRSSGEEDVVIYTILGKEIVQIDRP
jgi:hypothetical protein